MTHRQKVVRSCAVVASVAIPTSAVLAQPAIIDFDSIAPGTVYGNPVGDMPGDLVLTEDGIDMSVEDFTLGMFVGFFSAEVGGPVTASAFPTQALDINNINVKFDFSNVGFSVTSVSFLYADFGGEENLGVNGTVLELGLLSSAPAMIGGVNVNVTEVAISGGVRGMVTLTGPISTVTVGGQEFGIDEVVAIPAPASTLMLLAGATGVLGRRRR